MDRLPDPVVPPEGERHVRDTAGRAAPRERGLQLPDRFDERDGVRVVLLHPRRDREDVGVEDDVLGQEPDDARQQVECPPQDGHPPLDRLGLASLVEGHDDDGGAVAAAEAGLAQELRLPLLERDRVDDALALELLEPRLDDRPFRAVDHDRHGRDVGLCGDPPEEAGHRGDAVEHRLVHVDVDELGAVGDLLAGDVDGLVLVPLGHEPCELARAGHVRPLADVDEGISRPRDDERLESRQAGETGGFRDRARRQTGHRRHDRRDMGRSGPAAAARDVEQPVLRPLPERTRHLIGCLVVSAEVVGQAGVRVRRDRPIGDLRQDVEMLAQLSRAEGAVETDDERIGVADAVPEGFDRLARQGSARGVDDRPGDDDRKTFAQLVEEVREGRDRCLRVERVEDGLDQEDVRAALDQTRRRFAVGDLELRPGDAPGRRVLDVRAHRGSLVGGSERAGDVARTVGPDPFGGVGGGPGEPGGRDIELANRRRIEAIVRLGDTRRGEGVRGDDVRARLEIGLVRGADRRRLGQAEEVGVAAQVAWMIAEALTAEVGLAEPVDLEERAHRSVEDDDPVTQDPGQRRATRGPIERWCDDCREDGGGGHAGAAPWAAIAGEGANGSAGCRARIRRTSSAHCS